MILDSPSQSIEIYLAGAVTTNELPFFVTFNDISSTPFGYANSKGTTDGATAVKISGDFQKDFSQRNIKSISIPNKDTVQQFLYVRFNDDGDYAGIALWVLNPDDNLFYHENRGWYVTDKYGAPKTNSVITFGNILIFGAGTDDYTGTNPGITSLFDGLAISVKIPNNNTGPVTIDVGFGADAALNFVDSPFNADELQAGGWYDFQYDGTNWLCKTPTDLIQNNV